MFYCGIDALDASHRAPGGTEETKETEGGADAMPPGWVGAQLGRTKQFVADPNEQTIQTVEKCATARLDPPFDHGGRTREQRHARNKHAWTQPFYSELGAWARAWGTVMHGSFCPLERGHAHAPGEKRGGKISIVRIKEGKASVMGRAMQTI